MKHHEILREKVYESVASVLPITAIVLVLSITIVPLTPGTMVLFLFGTLLLIFGMGLFTMGAEMAMIPIGESMGAQMSRSKKAYVPFISCFILGVLITMAEPDLQVLANQVSAVPNLVLILTVAAGVGLFLTIAEFRMLLKIPLSHILIIFYIMIFGLAILAPETFIPVSRV